MTKKLVHLGRSPFILVKWPLSQDLMDLPGWEENSVLVNDEPFIRNHCPDQPSASYLVSLDWLETSSPDIFTAWIYGKAFNPTWGSL